jgi:hypothetical protein
LFFYGCRKSSAHAVFWPSPILGWLNRCLDRFYIMYNPINGDAHALRSAVQRNAGPEKRPLRTTSLSAIAWAWRDRCAISLDPNLTVDVRRLSCLLFGMHRNRPVTLFLVGTGNTVWCYPARLLGLVGNGNSSTALAAWLAIRLRAASTAMRAHRRRLWFLNRRRGHVGTLTQE